MDENEKKKCYCFTVIPTWIIFICRLISNFVCAQATIGIYKATCYAIGTYKREKVQPFSNTNFFFPFSFSLCFYFNNVTLHIKKVNKHHLVQNTFIPKNLKEKKEKKKKIGIHQVKEKNQQNKK